MNDSAVLKTIESKLNTILPTTILNSSDFDEQKLLSKVYKTYIKKQSSSIDEIVINLISNMEYKYYQNHFLLNKINSPLRYPGAKSKVLNRFTRYFLTHHDEYREPFAGGASIFLGKHKVKKNILNDKDYNVYSFLNCVKESPELLCDLILETTPTIELWKKIKSSNFDENMIDTAFKFLFLNRTNYSGIYNANPLGGLQQNSKYKIDCRWNPIKLCNQIKSMSIQLQNVTLLNTDFESIITKKGKDVLLIIDPPYYKKGDSLYSTKMDHDDHLRLADLLRKTKHKYLLTIDDCEETREIYLHSSTFINQESWKYTIHSKKVDNNGKELFISNFKVD